MKKKNIRIDFACLMMRMYLVKARVSCHEMAYLLHYGLKELGYNVKLVHGYYKAKDKTIIHSWVEYKDSILETNAGRIGIKTKEGLPFGIIKNKTKYVTYSNVEHKHNKKEVRKVLATIKEYINLVK